MSTITLPNVVNGPFSFQSGNVYLPNAMGTTINNASTVDKSHTGIFDNQSNFTIEGDPNNTGKPGITFIGNGIAGDNTNGAKIRNIVIQNARRGGNDYQGIKMSGPQNLLIENVSFVNCAWAAAIFGTCQNIILRGWKFSQCSEHLQMALAAQSQHILIQKLLASGSGGGYIAEIIPQDQSKSLAATQNITDVILDSLAVIKPQLYPGGSTQNTGGISMPLEHATGVKIIGFYLNGTSDKGDIPSGSFIGPALCMEIGGNAPTVQDCWIQNANDPLSVNTVTVNPNIVSLKYTNCREVPDFTGKPNKGKSPFPNNGPDQAVNCGGLVTAGIVVAPPPSPPPPPVVTPPPAPTLTLPANFIGTINADGTITGKIGQ